MTQLRIEVSEERREKLQRIMAHYGLASLTAAIWFAVSDLCRRCAEARRKDEGRKLSTP
jgi:hypothetical protein